MILERTFLFLFFLFFCNIIFSQQPQRIVTGTITDAETGEPVAVAVVFVAGSTVGVTTSNNGVYRLNLHGSGVYELVVSHVGYEPVTQIIQGNRALTMLDISIKPHEIEEITITAQRSVPRKIDHDLFWKTLLGEAPSKTIYVTNHEIVNFNYNTITFELEVSSYVPIQIINLETGYKMYFVLQQFHHNYLNNVSRWSGHVFFEELIPKNNRQKRQWIANRKSVYSVSINRFIRALYEDTLLENGFLLINYLSYDNNNNMSVLLPNKYLYSDSVTDSKIFRLSSDSTLLLACFGKPVTYKNISDLQNAFMTKNNLMNHIYTIGQYRNIIRLPEGSIRIFPDGTYMHPLRLRVYYSKAINGLNMMLPLEFGMLSESEFQDIDYENDNNNFILAQNNLLSHHPEKIYLTTDRSMYAAGDTVWISAWVLNAATLEPTDKSRMLHVELIRPDGTILRHLILETINGLAFGQIALPATIPDDALFRLRAYTRWTLNFDESYRFEKTVPIVQFRDNIWQGPIITEREGFEWVQRTNGSWIWRRKSVDAENVDNLEQKNDILSSLDLQFLPESGRWITGLPSRMAFKAIAEDGLGVNVEGEIFNDLNEKVADFQSLHNGMGSVFLVPQPERTYHARLFSGHTVDLPTPDSTGIVISIQRANNDTLTLQLYFSPDIVQRREPYYLAVCSRGAHVDAFEVTPLRTRMTMQLLTDDFQTGIARFTLLTKDGIPCNERLVFVDKDDQIKLQFSSSKESNAINLKLQANDAFGNPLHGIFTVSVTDSLYGSHDARDACLRSQMLLSSDLKGKIENPGWYFQDRDSLRLQALDLVMKTHGWNGYSWKNVEKWEDMIVFQPEIERTVSGRVTNILNRPAKDISVTLWLEGGSSIFAHTFTDAYGRFMFEGLQPVEKSRMAILAKYQRGNKRAFGLGVELDKQPEIPIIPVKSLSHLEEKTNWDELFSILRIQRQAEQKLLDSLLIINNINVIEELIIEGERPRPRGLIGAGTSAHVLYKEDIERYDRHSTLYDLINAEFSQLEKVPWFEIESLRTNYMRGVLPDNYMLWSFNGRPVYFYVDESCCNSFVPADNNWILNDRFLNIDFLFDAWNDSKFLWNISATDISSIELIDNLLWTDTASFINMTKNPLILVITTFSKNTPTTTPRIGTARQHLHGFSIPKTFYVPKYYPEDIVSQAEYDIRPTLYWNPEVVTDRDGKAEISFPIGEKSRSLQIRVEGTDLRGGIGSAMGELIIDN